MLVNKTKAAKNGAIILLDPQVWYLSGGGIISLDKMISEVEAAFTDKNNYSVFIHHEAGRTTLYFRFPVGAAEACGPFSFSIC